MILPTASLIPVLPRAQTFVNLGRLGISPKHDIISVSDQNSNVSTNLTLRASCLALEINEFRCHEVKLRGCQVCD